MITTLMLMMWVSPAQAEDHPCTADIETSLPSGEVESRRQTFGVHGELRTEWRDLDRDGTFDWMETRTRHDDGTLQISTDTDLNGWIDQTEELTFSDSGQLRRRQVTDDDGLATHLSIREYDDNHQLISYRTRDTQGRERRVGFQVVDGAETVVTEYRDGSDEPFSTVVVTPGAAAGTQVEETDFNNDGVVDAVRFVVADDRGYPAYVIFDHDNDGVMDHASSWSRSGNQTVQYSFTTRTTERYKTETLHDEHGRPSSRTVTFSDPTSTRTTTTNWTWSCDLPIPAQHQMRSPSNQLLPWTHWQADEPI